MPKISIAHATRRPAKALEIRKLWQASAAHPENLEYIFGIDADDAAAIELLASEPHTVSEPGGGCVRAFNAASAKTTGDIIISGCDDVYPFPNWDDVLLARLGELSKPSVLLTGDGVRSDRLATQIIITRGWYDKFGFMFPPQFKNLGPDVWLTERAARDGCLIDARDLVFEHRHPFYKKAPMDAVYQVQNDPERFAETNRILAELLEPLPISLCLIVGNEAAIIERLLNSAAGAFDELCLVRAIGSNAADQTEKLARQWCSANGKGFQFSEYKNQPANDWPHCDDFAAARNQSFALATKHWCLWLDADDLLDVDAVKNIREAAANTRFEGQRYRYQMTTGGEFYRERLIKRGLGNWSGRVHETCDTPKHDFCDVGSIIIQHAPHEGKNSAGRNLRILESSPEKTPRMMFYYHEELLRAGRKPEASAAGISALNSLSADHEVERYEICLNLAELEPAKTEHWCFEALKLSPARREAVAQLVQYALHCKETARAVVYFRWLDVIAEPKPNPWTHRPIWYGWARNYLRVLIYRAANDPRAATEHAKFIESEDYAAGVKAFETV